MQRINLFDDAYYSKEHISLYLQKTDAIFEFEYTEGDDKFHTISIKRPITKIADILTNEGYYDLESAYGYGGYLTTTEDKTFLTKALDAYTHRCNEEDIIAEFIRFHPYNRFPVLAKDKLNFMSLDRETVTIDVSCSKEERWAKYSGTTRNILRKNTGHFEFRETVDIDQFMDMYRATMDQNNADPFYYFQRNYYERLLARDNVKMFEIVSKDTATNMCFILLGNNIAYYHLSAKNLSFAKDNGNYHLIDQVCDYLNSEFLGITLFHLGGGRTNLDNDSLLSFKSKFSSARNDFYIGGKIFNEAVYNRYCNLYESKASQIGDSKYFLKYRQEVK